MSIELSDTTIMISNGGIVTGMRNPPSGDTSQYFFDVAYGENWNFQFNSATVNVVSTGGTENYSVTFSNAFAAACVSVMATVVQPLGASANSALNVVIFSVTTTGFAMVIDSTDTGPLSSQYTVYWIAWGY